MSNEPKLCYVQGNFAYFTTQELLKQWGDDWDDAPYEHNAGEPYTWGEYDRAKGIEPWVITRVAFRGGNFTAICESDGNDVSVQTINNCIVPWLRSGSTSIWAGTSFPDFVAAIKSCGGSAYEEVQEAPPVNDVTERLKGYGERIGLAEGEILHIKDVAGNRNAWLNDRINRLMYQVEENERGRRTLDKKSDDHEHRIAVLEEWVGMLIAHTNQPWVKSE